MIGDPVRITASGTFNGCIGIIRDIRQKAHNARAFYWIEIPDHPWGVKLNNPLWSFERREIELV